MKPARMVVLADTLVELYETMARIRHVEERLAKSYLEGLVPGVYWGRMGVEGLAAALCFHLGKNDLMFAPSPGAAYAVARGMPLDSLFAEYYGRRSGCAGGHAGPALICDTELGFYSLGSVPGAPIMEAVGAAWALQMAGQPRVAVAVFDFQGAASGAFHEGLYLAAQQHLPVVFVSEHAAGDSSAHGFPHLSAYAKAYELVGYEVASHDLVLVYSAVFDAVRRAREAKGPVLIDCSVHYIRSPAETPPHPKSHPPTEWHDSKEQDPLRQLRNLLHEMDPELEAQLTAIDKQLLREVTEAHQQAANAPWPNWNPEESGS
ncbi:MAG: acetoin:2,6-dichlorophenolindophenol oxidoreductase subunit alpha [Pirellulaceae bacterium]|nr:MAG: acetoin:2,6-dichlorophenolindophenol oxidoreductase subunit alpha [Pirellulaceae bacterium]